MRRSLGVGASRITVVDGTGQGVQLLQWHRKSQPRVGGDQVPAGRAGDFAPDTQHGAVINTGSTQIPFQSTLQAQLNSSFQMVHISLAANLLVSLQLRIKVTN